MAANVGGPVQVEYRSFVIDNPEMEKILVEGGPGVSGYIRAFVCGAEVIKAAE
jgi:hypothetical protein